MLDSTANEVVVTQQEGGQCPQHQGEYGSDAMDGSFIQTFHSEVVCERFR